MSGLDGEWNEKARYLFIPFDSKAAGRVLAVWCLEVQSASHNVYYVKLVTKQNIHNNQSYQLN